MLDADGPEKSLRELISTSASPVHKRVFNGLEALYIFCMVKVFGRFAFQREYLRGRWFEHFYSPGWRWAYNGMFSKLFRGTARGIPWPVSSQGTFGRNIDFHIDDLNLFQMPSYYQTFEDARIRLGRGVLIARGCALITTNHDPENPAVHLEPQNIEIGESSWLGANVVVMPGVVLGPHTVVGANAVVTKSFPEGYCLIAGAPAQKVKNYARKHES